MMIKKLYLMLLAMLVLQTGYAQQYLFKFKDASELQRFFRWTPKRYPLISAHRGGPVDGFPENAIETFANSIKFHPTIIECDASLTKDSVLVMMHDDRLDRTSNGTGLLRDKTLSELATIRLKDNRGKLTSFQIPTLDAVLGWGRNKVIFTLDVKRGVPYKSIIDAIRRTRTESCSIVITYNANQAAEVHRLAPDLMISASIRSLSDLERLNQIGVPNDRIIAFVGTSAPDQSVYDALHARGIWCILGTMGNLDKSAVSQGDKLYTKLIENGADVLSSDRSMESGTELLFYADQHQLKSKHLTRTKR